MNILLKADILDSHLVIILKLCVCMHQPSTLLVIAVDLDTISLLSPAEYLVLPPSNKMPLMSAKLELLYTVCSKNSSSIRSTLIRIIVINHTSNYLSGTPAEEELPKTISPYEFDLCKHVHIGLM